MGAHYLAFFRRMVIKFDYLPLDPNRIRDDLLAMQKEVTKSTEWTLFDDANLRSIGNWKQVVEHCCELRIYPTAILYEKLDQNE